MAFDLTIDTRQDGQFNWFGLPDSDRPALEQIREKFNMVDFRPTEWLIIEGLHTTFEKPYAEITGITLSR